VSENLESMNPINGQAARTESRREPNGAAGVRSDWQTFEIVGLLQAPLLELLDEARAVHQRHHADGQVQLASLLSIKTGACPEDCKYCPQSAHYAKNTELEREALLDGFDEAIMLDTQGLVSECTGENIFIVRDGKIKTPPLYSVLDGITRASMIDVARDRGFEVIETQITRDDLYVADEIFLTGTAADLGIARRAALGAQEALG